MPDATNYLALLRERGILGWKALGRQLYREIPKDENHRLSKTQIESYLQHSLGLTRDRAAELLRALNDIGILEAVEGADRGEKLFALHKEVSAEEATADSE